MSKEKPKGIEVNGTHILSKDEGQRQWTLHRIRKGVNRQTGEDSITYTPTYHPNLEQAINAMVVQGMEGVTELQDVINRLDEFENTLQTMLDKIFTGETNAA